MVKVKTFIQALSLFSSHPEKSKRFLEDKRLTQAEKNILKGYFLYRDSKFPEVINLLSDISDITDTVVRSQYHLLRGLCFGNMHDFNSGKIEVEKSLKYLQDIDLKYFKFVAHLNLFTFQYNTQNVAGMQKQIKLLKGFKMLEQKETIRLLFCQFLYFSFLNDDQAAKDVLEELDGLKPVMSESDIVNILLQEFEFFIKLEDIERAKSVLVEMKNNRKFALSESYRYNRKMLDHYLESKPLYFQDQEFVKQPALLYHIKVIQQLEECKIDQAKIWWDKLAEMYPESYKPDFKYCGPQTLFSLCFDLHKSALSVQQIGPIDSQEKSYAIIEFLKKSKGPVAREILFKFLWGREASEKEDFIRLSRKIYRIKKQFDLNIEYRKGCYLLSQSEKDKAS